MRWLKGKRTDGLACWLRFVIADTSYNAASRRRAMRSWQDFASGSAGKIWAAQIHHAFVDDHPSPGHDPLRHRFLRRRNDRRPSSIARATPQAGKTTTAIMKANQ
jgi:hypothetical protein